MKRSIEVVWSITQTARYLNHAGRAKLHAACTKNASRTLCGIDTSFHASGAVWEGDGRTEGDGQAWPNCKRCLKALERTK